MDTSHIDTQIQQENTRHEQEIIRINKAKQDENDLHKHRIDNLNAQKERLIQHETLDNMFYLLDIANEQD